jgi:hypothetical protein
MQTSRAGSAGILPAFFRSPPKNDPTPRAILLKKAEGRSVQTHERPSTYNLIRLIPQGSPPVSTGTWIPQPHFSAALNRVKPIQQNLHRTFRFVQPTNPPIVAPASRSPAEPHTSKIHMECGASAPLSQSNPRLPQPRPTAHFTLSAPNSKPSNSKISLVFPTPIRYISPITSQLGCRTG